MKKALIFGAGNIGRGFIGQLFSQSGYEIVFVDISETLIETINKKGSYPITIVSNEGSKEITVGPVRGIDGRDIKAVVEEIVDANLMATAVGMRALGKVSETITAGLKKRWAENRLEPINIIICENMLNADKYMEEVITSEMGLEEQNLFQRTVGLVEASIGRMVPVVVQDEDSDPLQVFVEEYDQLPVDKEGFKGEIPNIKNMIPYSPFIYYIHRKLFMHNMGHAITAYLGFLKGYQYIWEAVLDPEINGVVKGAFKEAAEAISKEHGAPMEELMVHAEDLLNRFTNRALADTAERVAKDPIRKLAIEDRLGGTASLCTQHGILPKNICLGIAAGFLYDSSEDEAALKVQEYIAKKGIEEAVAHFCSFEPGNIKHKLTSKFYNQLKTGSSPGAVLRLETVRD